MSKSEFPRQTRRLVKSQTRPLATVLTTLEPLSIEWDQV